jgi:hypothetical protein
LKISPALTLAQAVYHTFTDLTSTKQHGQPYLTRLYHLATALSMTSTMKFFRKVKDKTSGKKRKKKKNTGSEVAPLNTGGIVSIHSDLLSILAITH